MDSEPLYPRDSEWTVERPAYRVFFWRPLEAPRPVGGATADQSRAYRLEGADPTVVPPTEGADTAAVTPPGHLDPEQVDLDELANALQDQGAFDLHEWMLDRATGEVVFVNLDTGLEEPEDDLEDADHLVPIEPIGSGIWYGDMVDFAEGIGDEQTRRRLGRALRGKGAFRRFNNVLYDGSPDLVSVWHAFHDARARRRAVEWLQEHQLVTEEAAQAFFARNPDPGLR